MTYEHILVEQEDGVGILTLNRPDKLNAMNRKLSGELHEAVMQLNADEEIGCIVITGAGTRAFSAGGDIHEQREDDRRHTQEELDAIRPPRRGSYEIAASAAKTPASAFLRPLTAGSTAPGPCPTRSAGRSPRSCCLPHGSSRPRKPIASVC
jgi:hypothetical protein